MSGGDLSNTLSGVGSSISSGLSNFASGVGNFFGGGGGSAGGTPLAGATDTGGGGFDPSSVFSDVSSALFNTTDPTGTQAAQASITPPAQAAQAAQSGQDPSSTIGGSQSGGTQTASTGPSGNPNQANQNDAEQDQRQRSFDELRKEIKRRQQHLKNPWTIGAAQAQTPPGVGRGPAGVASGLYSPNISPDAAVRAGLLDPSMIDPTTGQINRDRPPAQPDELTETPPAQRDPTLALPEPSGATGAGQVVPSGGGGGPPAAPPAAPSGGGPSIAGLLGGGLGSLASKAFPWFAPPIGAAEQILWNTTPAETGELPPYKGPSPEDYPDSTNYPQAQPGQPQPPPQAQPPAAKKEPPPKKKAEPKKAEKPRQVWVPETPGHYVPRTGQARGPAQWVRGTPGHYETVPAGGRQAAAKAAPEGAAKPQGSPPAANQPDTSVPTRKDAEAAPGPALAYGGPMAGTENMSPMLRDMLGIAMPVALMALAGGLGGRGPRQRIGGLGGFHGRPFPPFFRGGPLNAGYYPNASGGIGYHPGGYHPGWGSSASGQGGTRPYAENWGGSAYVARGDEVARGRQYMAYLTNKGVTRQGAAALLGNAHQESNLSASLSPGGDGGTAAGMFQWRGPRQAAFRQWLQANGRSAGDPNAHLDFALYEMQTNPAYRQSWDALHNPNLTAAQIADIVANNYEVSARGPTQGMNNRIGFANSMLQGGAGPDQNPVAAAPPAGNYTGSDQPAAINADVG